MKGFINDWQTACFSSVCYLLTAGEILAYFARSRVISNIDAEKMLKGAALAFGIVSYRKSCPCTSTEYLYTLGSLPTEALSCTAHVVKRQDHCVPI